MNPTPTSSIGQLKDYGSGWGAFTRWLIGAVVMVFVFFGFAWLGGWSEDALVRRQGAGLLESIAGTLVFGALSALGFVLLWNYFARVRHSATWFVRMWLFAFAFGGLLGGSSIPWWLSIATFVLWFGFLLWTRKAWGMNWMEGERPKQETARA
jgi:hypothetical protein